MSYNGKRISENSRGLESPRPRARTRTSSGPGNTLFRVLFFPLLFLYLELVLHISMGMSGHYFLIYLLFSLAAGFLFSALCMPFPQKLNSILTKIFTWILCIVFCIELVCKTILQSYYPLSSLGLAAGNRLTDYSDVIVTGILHSILPILLFILPAIFVTVLGGRMLRFKRYDIRFSGLLIAAALIFHIFGLGVIHLPWSGDVTPKMLYQMDTNIDDQVEQLGLWSMLRLDVKHMFIPAKNGQSADFDDLGDNSKSDKSKASETENSVDTSPNVMDVDLESLASQSSNKDIQWLANYFNSVTPTNKNEYTGMFKDYNVIQLVIEGFSGYAIDKELTPTLYKLSHEGFVFNNYYTALHFTSTSNGECQTLLGLYPKNGTPTTMPRTGEVGMNCYFSLAQQLGREGYQVMGYHGNYNMYGRQVSHENLGYTWKQYKTGLEVDLKDNGDIAWPARDTQVIENSVDDYINSDQPFHVYYLTISGHTPYSNNRIVSTYRDTVRALPYSEKTQNYVATAMEVDRSLELLLQKLEEAGKLDKTLIVATGDHIPYFDIDVLEELSGQKFGSSDDMQSLNESAINFDVYKNTLFLWSASMDKPIKIDKPCCQVDILPTVSNLLGLTYDSRMLAGSDILSDSEGQVVFTSRSWMTDKGFYNRYTQKFTPAEGVEMTEEEQDTYVSNMKKRIGYKLDSTAMIVENNFYNAVFASN